MIFLRNGWIAKGAAWPTLGLVAALAAACGDDGAPSGSSESGSATQTSGGSDVDTDSATTADTTSDSDTTDTEGTTSQSTSDSATGETTAATTGQTTGETTGGEQLCGLSEQGDEPWFEVSAQGQPLQEGGALALECGGQGAFMFELKVELGGFVPAGEYADFAVTMDVEGFNVGPEGHFFHADPYQVFIGCEEDIIGGLSQQNYIRIFPPDEIADFAMLDGAAATLSFTLQADGQSIPLELPMTISAVNENEAWCFCLGDPECF